MANLVRNTANLVLALNGLIGKGAQKTRVNRFAQNIQEQYIQAAQTLINQRRSLENKLEDLVMFSGIATKTGQGMEMKDAVEYVQNRVKIAVELEQLDIRIDAIKYAYREDFGKEVPVVDTSILLDIDTAEEEEGA